MQTANTLSSIDKASAAPVAFFGHDLDLDAAETLLITRWPMRERLQEPRLFATKDWDERMLHPAVATYRFAHLFTQETRAIIRAHVNDAPPRVTASGKVVDWEPLKAGDLFEPPSGDKAVAKWQRKVGSVIRARQWADQHGVPYRFMARTALRIIYFNRGYLLQRTTLPDPGLLNGEEMREALLLAWVEQLGAAIQHGTHPRYLVASGDPHPDVDAHQRWLLAQIRRRSQPHFACAKFARLGYLDPARIAPAFGEHVARKAAALLA